MREENRQLTHSLPTLPSHAHNNRTGKCIARKNLKCFYLFITTLLIHIVYVIAIFAASLVEHYNVFPQQQQQQQQLPSQ